jgi:VWFA-related protein
MSRARFRRVSPTVLGLVVCVAGAWLTAQAQSQPQARPVFRSGIHVVPLTVAVVDRQGRPVAGLTQADFTIIEDGKPREIVAFHAQDASFVAREAAPVVGAALNRAADTALEPATRRIFLIALGHGRIQHPTAALDGTLQFVRERLLPQDLVAVMAFNRATDLTTDHGAVARLLERYRQAHEQLAFDIDNYWVHHRYDPLSEALQARIDDVFLGPAETTEAPAPGSARRDGSMRDATAMLIGMDEAAFQMAAPAWQRPVTFGELKEAAYLWSLSDVMVRSGLLKVYAGLEYLRHLDGQKHLVFVGSGLRFDRTDQEARLARRLNHAGVAFHMVETAGTPAPGIGGRAPSLGFLSLIQGAQNVTSLTGGSFTGVSYTAAALSSIDRVSRSSYLIGYVPSDPQRDGRYRDVKVQVSRANAIVRAPGGYYAAEQPDAIEVEDLVTRSRLESLLSATVAAQDIRIDGTATLEKNGAWQLEIVVAGRIDASRLAFTGTGWTRSLRLGLTVEGLDAGGKWVGRTTGELRISANNDSYAEYMLIGVPFSLRFAVASAPVSVTVVVYDYGADLSGTRVLKITR